MTIDVADEIDSSYPVFSYTATKLSPVEVAKTFVPPPAFKTLRDARNAILVGPRGSGKTTLLKMLTSEGLSAWAAEEAVVARERVQDVGVFVGVDAMWSEQIASGDRQDSDSFGAAAYALHIARAFTQALTWHVHASRNRPNPGALHIDIPMSREAETQVVSRASRLFKLEGTPTSLLSLDYELGDRLNELGTYRYRLVDGQKLPDWAYLNPLHAVAELANMVNAAVGQPSRKWSLLFDELELAPEAIVNDILRRLRGHEETLVFKLSLAPILKSTDLLTGEKGATHGQDVEYISLTTAERSDDFVADIFLKQRQAAALSATLTPEVVLGPSIFDAGDIGGRRRSNVDPYRKGARVWNAMHWLSNNDVTFARYLRDSKVSLDSLDSLSSAKRAGSIRKIRNLTVIRAHFRQGARLETQSTRQLYTGEVTMLSIPDGNPRMSTILVRSIMSTLADEPNLPLDRKAQAEAIESTSARFLALLHAQVGVPVGGRFVTMVSLIDAIGRALHSRIVDDNFSGDVPAGFFVDESVPLSYFPLLTQAVNTGAIIHIPKDNSSSPVSGSVLGRHYRLSYLLAPRYGLPIRQGKTVALWKLLESSLDRSQVKLANQPTLVGLENDDE